MTKGKIGDEEDKGKRRNATFSSFPNAAMWQHIVDESHRFLGDAGRRCPCLCN